MPTLRYNMLRGDMITVYSIWKIPQRSVPETKSMDVTGRCSRHSLMLFQERGGCRNLELKKHSFTMRVVAVWNSLTEKWRRLQILTALKEDWTSIGSMSQ